MDTEKAFVSLDQNSSDFCYKKKMNLVNTSFFWIKIFSKHRKSSAINGEKSTIYYRLERGAGHGVPISTFLIILILEIFFPLLKTNSHIKDTDIFYH